MRVICDPPEGWKYGFPRPCPQECLGDDPAFTAWLRSHGYPEQLMELALKHSRFWDGGHQDLA